MGLLQRVTGSLRRALASPTARGRLLSARRQTARARHFEHLEPRNLMAADPLQLGAVYIEQDIGSDQHGDTFEITFVGGAPGTQLTQLIISGDQGTSGRSRGDVLFDTQDGGWGADQSLPFTLVALETRNPQATVSAQVEDGSHLLVLNLTGFQAGDKLIFQIDVDEIEDYDPSMTSIDEINEGLDPITSGVEFQGSRLQGTFSAPHYFDIQATAEFRNQYDALLAGRGLDLPPDNAGGQRDRTAGGAVDVRQVFRPAELSGYVFHDRNNDGRRDAGEEPIGGVTLTITPLETIEPQGTVILQTDANGFYRAAGLAPGTYQVRETHPLGYLDGSDSAGTVDGHASGSASNPGDLISGIVLGGGQVATEYNFGELLPVSIAGQVHLTDRHGDCFTTESLARPLENVVLRLLDAEGRVIAETTTNAQGEYEFSGLRPGVYSIVEHTPAGLIDGDEHVGGVNGQMRGAVTANDTITGIVLASGEAASGYDFCEHEPGGLSGHVYFDANQNGRRDADEHGISHVQLILEDEQGIEVARQVTNAAGYYEFTGLMRGGYTIRELHPAGWIDGLDAAGQVQNVTNGIALNPGDRIDGIELLWGDQGQHYNFGELQPVRIAGWVYHDRNNNGLRDAGEAGLAGVPIDIVPVQTSSPQAVVRVVTDVQGAYAAAGLVPGRYRVVQVSQPIGFVDGLDAAGTVAGLPRGHAINPGDRIEAVDLLTGQAGIDYNFGELQLVSIAGRVYLTSREGDCIDDENQQRPLAGVTVLLRDATGSTILAETTTDEAGYYRFDGLMPGTYTVQELTPAGLIDGGQHIGTVDGLSVGRLIGVDMVGDIQLASGQQAVHYDFCEHEPASLAGFVYHDRNGNGNLDSDEQRLSGVQIELLDASGTLVATAHTVEDGFYSFHNLRAGTYRLREQHPDGWLDGSDAAGTVGGTVVGLADNPGDEIRQIQLWWGDTGIDYNFGEWLPVAIAGLVHADPDQDCLFDADELPLAGVTIQLLDHTGQVVGTTQTDATGRYRFEGLTPGTYALRQLQPQGYFQGGQRAGSAGGDATSIDLISAIALTSGQEAVDYDFCEIPPSSLSGYVHADTDGDCVMDENEERIAGVTIRLLDAQGQVIATTLTDIHGHYRFENLPPGQYTVQELQPAGYFNGPEHSGSHDGEAIGTDQLVADLPAGTALTDYNFCEIPPSSLSGYVFQDGPTIVTIDGRLPSDVRSISDGRRTSDDRPLAGVWLELRDGEDGSAIDAHEALPGHYAAGSIRVVTDANGFYQFTGLHGGRPYAVYQRHPDGYIDGLDTPGSSGGIAINPGHEVSDDILQRLTVDPESDAVILIPLGLGESSTENNFSELRVDRFPPPPPPPPPLVTPRIQFPVSGIVPQARPAVLVAPLPLPAPPPIPIYGSSGVLYTWHLSVVDGGMPRGRRTAPSIVRVVSLNNLPSEWTQQPVDRGQWRIMTRGASGFEAAESETVFGVLGATPLTGDFNGDGVTEIAVFSQGYFFVDLNGNGRWDEGDLWLQLGHTEDLAVVGDWNGDGKDDIGIYGPAWPGDARAAAADPGLPDVANRTRESIPKNVPPPPHVAAVGQRLLKRTADGPLRADLVDHVFRYGQGRELPVSGDWNGDGIDSIGVFHNGHWRLDRDGDGRWSTPDYQFRFGQPGDLPVVGDFDGNGVDEIGVYRAGTWYIDANRNRELDAHDTVFQLGSAEDLPVVGDWDGDGKDEPGLYGSSGGLRAEG